jgi:osmotically-inducible protein OsmY
MKRQNVRGTTVVAVRRGFRVGTSALVAAVLVLAWPAAAAAANRDLADADVRAAIEDEFQGDRGVPFHTMNVEVAEGVATLTGTVDTLLARRRAVDLASAIKGVRSVVDRLQVDAAPRPDAELHQAIEAAMQADAAADAYEVRVSVSGGVATLAGTVDSWQEKQIVSRVAESVEGVRDVRNQVTVAVPPARPDTELEAEIRGRLRRDARVDDGLVSVSVRDGLARLTGSVGSALEKGYAKGLARVPGVRAVDVGGLDVEWWARDDMRRDKYVLLSDEQLKRAVEDALGYDPRVLSFDPIVEVRGGVVTLGGTVDNLEARRAAERDARNTVGVVDVRNHLRVRPRATATDEELAQGVRQALARDPYMRDFVVSVTASSGEVRLAGEADSEFEKVYAETVAAGVPGVVDVRNDMRVRAPRRRADRAIERDIEDELLWSPFVDSDEVNVTVRNGVATLTGSVDTWADYAWAEENAREGGARAVENDLSVRNGQGAFWDFVDVL